MMRVTMTRTAATNIKLKERTRTKLGEPDFSCSSTLLDTLEQRTVYITRREQELYLENQSSLGVFYFQIHKEQQFTLQASIRYIFSLIFICQLQLTKQLVQSGWNFLSEPMHTLGVTKAKNIIFFFQIPVYSTFFTRVLLIPRAESVSTLYLYWLKKNLRSPRRF